VERERKDNLNAQEKIQLILKTQLNTEIKNLEAKNEE
jgi:phage-related tail protein